MCVNLGYIYMHNHVITCEVPSCSTKTFNTELNKSESVLLHSRREKEETNTARRTTITMGKLILAINAGSSSVKVSVYKGSSKDVEPPMLAEISVAGLTAPPAKLSYKRGDQNIKGQDIEGGVDGQEGAFEYVLKYLLNDDGLPELKQKEDIEFACHRIVHGGDYDHATRIDRDTYHRLEELSDLAPLYGVNENPQVEQQAH